MNDLLDDRLRTMMRTATTDAPHAPTVDDLQAITVVGAEPRQRSLRPVAAAAAVVALVAGGALMWRATGDGGPDPADSPETTEAAVTPGGYLDAYYLPSDLPDGWQIVEMNRLPSGVQVEYQGDTAVFINVITGGRATVGQEPMNTGESPATTAAALDPTTGSTVEAEPVAGSAADATWDPSIAWLTWRQEGRAVYVTPSDGLEATARSIAGDLLSSLSGTRVTFAVSEDSDWVKTAEYLLDGSPVVSSGSNSIQLVGGAQRTATLVVTRPAGLRASDIGIPVAGTSDIFVFPRLSTSSAARVLEPVQVEAFSHDGSVTNEELVSLLTSLVPVTEEEWLAARPDPNEVVARATVVGSFELLDHTITAHLEGGISGVCVERADGMSGCSLLLGVGPDGQLPPAAPTQGIPLSDGTWVAVGSIANGLEPCEEPLLQGARAAVVPNGDVQTMLVVPADQDVSFACPLSGTPEGGPAGSEVFIANPPSTP